MKYFIKIGKQSELKMKESQQQQVNLSVFKGHPVQQIDYKQCIIFSYISVFCKRLKVWIPLPPKK